MRDTLSRLESASGSELTYRRDEIVYSDLIAASDEATILAALNRFVAGARQAVIGRGARDVELSTDQVTSLSRAVAATPGEDLVVLVAADNFVGAAQVMVNVEAYENRELLEKGQLIASRQVLYRRGRCPGKPRRPPSRGRPPDPSESQPLATRRSLRAGQAGTFRSRLRVVYGVAGAAFRPGHDRRNCPRNGLCSRSGAARVRHLERALKG